MKSEHTLIENQSIRGKASILNVQKSRVTAVMTLVLSLLTLFACVEGIYNESIYRDALSAGTITNFLLVGSVGQDIIFIPLAVLLAVLSTLYLIRPGYKCFISMLGLTGNFFYGYGLYTMQGQYTSIYLIYLAIFGLSVYSLIFGLLSFKLGSLDNIALPKLVSISISSFLYSIVLILGIVWLARISPDIARHMPQDTYGVFILDLGIVFPAFAITATKLIRRRPVGNILAGVALMKAFTVCLSWGFGEWYGRIKGSIQGNFDMLMIPSVLTVISLFFFVLFIANIKEVQIAAKPLS